MFRQPTNDWQKGYEMVFDNGWTISVKWGAGAEGSNFTENHLEPDYRHNTARTAEVAAIYGDRDSNRGEDIWWNFADGRVEPDNRTSVSSFITPDKVADMITIVKNLWYCPIKNSEQGMWRENV